MFGIARKNLEMPRMIPETVISYLRKAGAQQNCHFFRLLQ